MKKLILLSIFAGFVIGMNAQNTLTVNVRGIDNPTGDLYVALYNSQTPFLGNNACGGKIVPINNKTIQVVFENLKEGQYGIAIYQDENGNKKLDMGEYNIPLEKYGFSNNIDPALIKRAPVFDECKFDVNGNTVISINLVSAIK